MLDMVLGATAGLGLFLYGMRKMADGLQKVAGNRLKSFVQALTKNRFMAVIVGTLVTMVIQSSSATSVMVVGFVNAGIMTLQQAIGIIFGANIGTTITGQLVSFNLSQFAPVAIATGLVLIAVTKKPHVKDIAEIFIGFGILFIGMSFLKEALGPLKESPVFIEWITTYGSQPLIGVAIGFVMTIVLQSSSATIGVLIALATQGIIPFSTALLIIYGDNIGTCTTALISSLGTSSRGRQVAVIHLSINIIGTLYFMLFLNGFITSVVTYLNPTDVTRQIANAHTIFNIVNVIVLLPFSNYIIKLAEWIVPSSDKDEVLQRDYVSYLDERILVSPPIALKNTIYEFIAMGNEASNTIEHAIASIRDLDQKQIEKAYEYEERVNTYEKEIVEYLVLISQQPNISGEDLAIVDELFSTVNDIERISDHAENIADTSARMIKRGIEFDEETLKDLDVVYDLVRKGFGYAMDAFSLGDLSVVEKVVEIEREVDRLKSHIRDKHIKRMNKKIASPESGIFAMDLLSDLERISDHFRNLAETAQKIEPVVMR